MKETTVFVALSPAALAKVQKIQQLLKLNKKRFSKSHAINHIVEKCSI